MVDSAFRNNLDSGLTRAEYLLFRDLIERASGLNLEDRDWTPLRAALCERVATIGFPSFGQYYELLESPEGFGELNRLIELLTIHETSFFRNRSHFDVLARHIVPEIAARNLTPRSMRLWSAGCSTGQEAYSIAMTLMESLPGFEKWQLEVLATDISHRALEVARAGVYRPRAVRNVDSALLERYFEPCEGGYRVTDQVRKLVKFEHLNLVKEPFPVAALRSFDVIFCENVTIYFKVDSTRRVIRNFYEVLREGGYLFLGYSESLWKISSDFVPRDLGKAFIYQRPSRETGTGSLDTPAAPAATERGLSHRLEAASPRRPAKAAQPAGPPRRTATLEEAAALYEARRFEEALLAVESILEVNPADLKAHLLAAKLRADREEVGPALRHCRRVLEIDPLLEEAHYLTGVLLLRAGEKEKAVDSLSRVIYLNPSGHRSALAHFHLAGLHAEGDSRIASIREYRNALRLLERFPKDELLEEFSADFLARVCRRRLGELELGS